MPFNEPMAEFDTLRGVTPHTTHVRTHAHRHAHTLTDLGKALRVPFSRLQAGELFFEKQVGRFVLLLCLLVFLPFLFFSPHGSEV